MNRSLKRFLLLSFTALALSCGSSLSAADSIQSFVKQKAKWNSLVGKSMTLEGRYSSIGKNIIRFRNCDLTFRSAKPLPRISGSGKTVEVFGRLLKENSRIVFAVDRLRELSSDTEKLRKKRFSLLGSAKPDDWYELGSWAENRGRFYKDQQLLDASKQAYRKGLDIEKRAIKADDEKAWYALIDKASKFKLPATLRKELTHTTYYNLWRSRRDDKSADLKSFAEKIARDLSDATIPIQPPDPKLRVRYQKDGLALYNAANEKTQNKLHRILYSDVYKNFIVRQLTGDYSNGFAIAAEIDKQVPEFHALAEQYRDQQLKTELTAVATYSRRQITDLAERLRNRDLKKEADKSLSDWLKNKERQLAKNDSSGRIQLAEDYLAILEDQTSAGRLLLEADQLTPKSEEITNRLEKLGYGLNDGKWLPPKALKAQGEDSISKAMREGRVEIGMTRAQVRKTLGSPTTISRIATAGRISEIWAFGQKSSSKLVVHFSSKNPTDKSKVRSVFQLNGR